MSVRINGNPLSEERGKNITLKQNSLSGLVCVILFFPRLCLQGEVVEFIDEFLDEDE